MIPCHCTDGYARVGTRARLYLRADCLLHCRTCGRALWEAAKSVRIANLTSIPGISNEAHRPRVPVRPDPGTGPRPERKGRGKGE